MFPQDVRYALRSLWRDRGLATIAILCLSLGIGVNTTIFSVIDGVLLQPYPYDQPDRILVLGARNPRAGDETGLSFLDLRDWKEATTAFSTIAAAQGRAVTVSDGHGEPERHLGAAVSWDLFPLLGVSPILGREFGEAEDQPNAGGVVLLSHDLWTSRYQGDPTVLGRSILVDARPHAVIGVMPPHFEFPENQRLWIPLAPVAAKDERDARYLFTFGRMKPGVTMAQAAADLEAVAARLANDYPATNDGWTAHVRTLRDAFLPDEVPTVLYLMMAGVTLVLFIACANVANLQLVRAAGRRRELAVRAALGAGRARIVRQLVTESVALGLAAVPLGIALAEAGTRLIASAMPADQLPYYVQWRVDWRSLVYAIAVAASTAFVFGLFPALHSSRESLHDALKEGSRGHSGERSRLRSALVVAQVSLALAGLVGALLFVRTFLNLDGSALGFDPKPLMTMRFYMAGDHYEVAGARTRRVEDVVRRVEGLAGVRAAFASNLIPISGGGGGGQVEIEGRTVDRDERSRITFNPVTAHFFPTLGVPVLRGRDFHDTEGSARTPVAIVNQTMASRFWPDGDALDRRFRLANASGQGEGDWFRVIGITPDLQLFGIDPSDRQAPASAFVPYAYGESLSTGLTIRVDGDPASITAAARAEIRSSDPNIPTYWVRTMEEVRQMSFWQYGLYGWVFGTIGVIGLLLAAAGVYGVLSYSVSQRTQEIGVRVALGADRGAVLKLVVGHGLWLAGLGVGTGLVLTALGTPLAKSLLYNVSPFDPFSFGIVSVFLVSVALAASYLPARRATRVDPVVALRGE